MVRKLLACLVLTGFVAGCAEEKKKDAPKASTPPAEKKTEEKKG